MLYLLFLVKQRMFLILDHLLDGRVLELLLSLLHLNHFSMLPFVLLHMIYIVFKLVIMSLSHVVNVFLSFILQSPILLEQVLLLLLLDPSSLVLLPLHLVVPLSLDHDLLGLLFGFFDLLPSLLLLHFEKPNSVSKKLRIFLCSLTSLFRIQVVFCPVLVFPVSVFFFLILLFMIVLLMVSWILRRIFLSIVVVHLVVVFSLHDYFRR